MKEFYDSRGVYNSVWMTGEHIASHPDLYSTYSPGSKVSTEYWLDVYELCFDLSGIFCTYSKEIPQTVVKKEHAFTHRIYRGALFGNPFDANQRFEQAINGKVEPNDNLLVRLTPVRSMILFTRNLENSCGIVLPKEAVYPILETLQKYWPEVKWQE